MTTTRERAKAAAAKLAEMTVADAPIDAEAKGNKVVVILELTPEQAERLAYLIQ